MYTYVCPVVCINIYFAPNVPKVWGLQSQPLGLLSLFQSNKTHPTPEHHLMFAWHGQQQQQQQRQCFTLGLTLTRSVFHISRLFCCRALVRLITRFTSRWRQSHLSSFLLHFLTGPGSGFQNSTLCKAPVCVSPFHPDDCNKREQMENLRLMTREPYLSSVPVVWVNIKMCHLYSLL